MFNPLIFVSAGRSKTNPSTPRLYQMRFSLLIIAFLATLSSAATVPERASTRIPTLLVDTSPPPSPQSSEELLDIFPSYINRPGLRDVEEVDSGDSNHATPRENGEMRRRNAKAVHTTTTTTPSKPTNSALASSSPLPEPFDNTPASAFQSSGSTDACPKFISNLLSNPTFKSCYPLSMMLQSSTGFFQAEKSLLSIVRVLDATCKADSSSCATFLDQAATNLTMAGNCKTEVEQNQTLVLQAYDGLVAYKTLYAATCLQDPSSSQYCFANAVTNLNTPSDAYLYFLPYGLALPGSSNPSCSWCTQQTMDIYYSASADRSSPVAGVYQAAARQVNTLCGPNYVNGTLPPASSGVIAVRPAIYTTTLAALCATLVILVSAL
ncbi:uncharacterized protein TrAFT101_001736 [Trichoderma asperellum]|nr:hypothetical protein TrAFT101_001736 [Trichoderma asperellum]